MEHKFLAEGVIRDSGSLEIDKIEKGVQNLINELGDPKIELAVGREEANLELLREKT